MIVFVNHDGSIALQSVSTINQGSVDANKITIVHPFSTAIVRLAFTLPNGIVLEEPKIASDSTSIPIDEYKGLSVSEYTLDRELTRVSGTLGVQIFFTYIDPTDKAEKRTVTIPTPLINIPINNGSRFIPDNVVGNDTDIIAIASAAKASAENAENSASAAQQSAANAEKNASDATTQASAAQKSAANAATSASAAQKSAANAATQASAAQKSAANAATSASAAQTSAATAVGTANEAKTEVTNSVRITPSDTSIPQTINSGIDVKGGVSASSVSATTASVTDLNATNIQSTNTTADVLFVKEIQGNNTDDTDNPNGLIKVMSGTHFEENVEIYGQLNVWGNIITRDYETLLTPSNIIVVNSDGTNLSRSGLVIRTDYEETETENGDYEYPAVAILYDNDSKTICVGEGILTERYSEEDDGEINYSFSYSNKDDGTSEAIPLAARDGFDGKGGYLPVWDADKNAFVPSDKRISENGNFEGDINVNGNVTGSEASFSKVEIHDGVNGNTITPDFASFNEIRAKNLVINGVDAETWVRGVVEDYIANNGGGGGDTAEIAEELRKINEGGVGE